MTCGEDILFELTCFLDGIEDSYKLKPKSLEIEQINDLIQNIDRLPYGALEAFMTDSLLIELFKKLKNIPNIIGDSNPEYILAGIQNMFRILRNNEPITAAPHYESDREKYYIKLAKGYRYLAELMQQEYIAENMTHEEIYWCIETIGDGGYACAGRWVCILEQLIDLFSDKIAIRGDFVVEKSWGLESELKSIFLKAKSIEIKLLADEFVQKYYNQIFISSKLHYVDFFQRYLNNRYNLKLPLLDVADSYIAAEADLIISNAQNFMSETKLPERILLRAKLFFTEKIAQDFKCYEQVIDWFKNIYYLHNLKIILEDEVEFLDKYIFNGFSRKINDAALIMIMKNMNFIEVDTRKINIDILSKLGKKNEWNKVYKILDYFEDLGSKINPLLIISIEKERLDVVGYLMKKGADINIQLEFGYTPLIQAIRCNNNKLLDFLIGVGANTDVKDDSGNTALIWAVKKCNERAVSTLIKNNADVNAKNKYGNTPLMAAIRLKNNNIIEFLMKSGAINNIYIRSFCNDIRKFER